MNHSTQVGTHDPEWMRSHEFTVDEIRTPGGRGLAYAAEKFHGNPSGRNARAQAERLDRIARLQHEAEADAALAAQQAAGGQ